MSVNKFGMSIKNDGRGGEGTSIESLRIYVRDNALCLSDNEYDAKNHKIRRVATPRDSYDATNKEYVENELSDPKRNIVENRQSIDSLRDYVKDSALCLKDNAYDAGERRIRGITTPQNDSDAVNKGYVEIALRNFRQDISRLDASYTRNRNEMLVYIRDNTLCLKENDYDARQRKIRGVATPENDSDVVTKGYLDIRMNSLTTNLTNLLTKFAKFQHDMQGYLNDESSINE